MPDFAIRVENLGKKYLIKHERNHSRYRTLREAVSAGARSMLTFGRTALAPATKEEFWAVRDLNFEIKQGEVVGIVGRNGAGKSTILKLFSRITEPTTGRIEINGRVSSLLEVGTGFHPELTGRENIYLNGAILGMSRREIARKFDEIVAFAEVEQFLDTPVKRYSSGMHVRLAFAVAAHLEPDIMILDEVLAVGDLQFQKKCLAKIGDIATETGRTVLFVTHDMAAFQSLCQRGLFLEKGMLVADKAAGEIVNIYLKNSQKVPSGPSRRSGNGQARFESFHLADESDQQREEFFMGENVILRATIRFERIIKHPIVGFEVRNALGELCAHVLNLDSAHLESGDGEIRIQVRLHHVYLAPNLYTINLWIGEDTMTTCDLIEGALTFNLLQGQDMKRGIPYPSSAKAYLPSQWVFTNREGRVISSST